MENQQSGQWTAEQFRDAKSLVAPMVLRDMLGELPERVLANSKPSSRSVSQGSAPTITVEPDNDNKLFDYVESEEAQAAYNTALPQGCSGQYCACQYCTSFTSSRVIPAPAVQNSYPYSATGKLYFKNTAGQTSYCTGVVIGLRLVLTAGQCIYDAVKKAYYKDFEFAPAYHQTKAPFGSWKPNKWIKTTKLWMDGKGILPNTGDFAILEMDDNAKQEKIGEVVGVYGWRIYFASPNLQPDMNHITTPGYSACFDKGEWMHRVDSNIRNTGLTGIVLYGADMGAFSPGIALIENFGERSDGQSQDAGSNRVLEVASFGYYQQEPDDSFSQSGLQGATLLNNEFLSLYNEACANKDGNCTKKK